MKQITSLLILCMAFAGCEKSEDNTHFICTSNCTTLSGRFVSLDNKGVGNIRVSLSYKIPGGELGGGSIRKIVETQSDLNGNFYSNFFIKDSELGNARNGYFQVDIDDSAINVNRYIRSDNLIGNTTVPLGLTIYSITRRDTVINNTWYIPKKTHIKVHLDNFVPQQSDDYFEVQASYPFGADRGDHPFLNSPYQTGFSGFGSFRATGLNNVLDIFAAEGETNRITVVRRKNGVNTFDDFLMMVPPNNTIELTYNY